MRDPDHGTGDAGLAWRVPLERVDEWASAHPDQMHRSVRDGRFLEVWKDLWYLLTWVSGGDIDDEVAEQEWFAVILRDLRNTGDDYPRLYLEAEWELLIERIGNKIPPVDGGGLHDQAAGAPLLLYQFHGLPAEVVLDVDAAGTSFAIYGVELLLDGIRPQRDSAALLSRIVNMLRERFELEPLWVGSDGILGELENGLPTTHPNERTI